MSKLPVRLFAYESLSESLLVMRTLRLMDLTRANVPDVYSTQPQGAPLTDVMRYHLFIERDTGRLCDKL